MDEHQFVVHYVVTRSESQAAQKAEQEGYREIAKTADATAKSVEAGTRQTAEVRKRAAKEALTIEEVAAKAREELIKRENAAKVKAATDSIDVAKKESAARKESEKEVADAARKADRDRLDSARKASKERRDLERAERLEQIQLARAARDADRQAAAESRAARRAERAQRRADAEATRLEEKRRLEDQKRSNQELDKAARFSQKFVGVLGQIGNAAFGLQGVASLVNMVAEAMQRSVQQAESFGKFAAEYRATLKELASLKGESAPTAGTLKGQLEYRVQTLQGAEEARATQEAFLNVSGISTDTADTKRRMSAKTAQEAMVFAGQMASRLGGDAGSFGELAGMIPTMEGRRVESSDIKRRMVQLSQLGEKGRATQSDFAKAMAQSSGLVTTGAYKDVGGMPASARMGAVGTALSITAPKEISTGLEQIHKITGKALFDVTPGPGAEMSPSDYLTGLGVTNQMDDLEILQKMFRDVERAEAESAKKGEQLNITEYLTKRGLVDQQDTARFKALYGARADLEKTFMPMAGNVPTLEAAEAPFKAFSGQVQGMAQKSQLAIEQAQIGGGIGAPEHYQSLERLAFATRAPGEMAGTLEDWKGSVALQEKMRAIVRGEGLKAGLPYAVGTPDEYGNAEDPLKDLMAGPGQIGGTAQQEAFYRRAIETKQKGGDPLGSHSPAVQEWMKRWDEQMKLGVAHEKLLTSIDKKLDPAAVQVAPPGGANAGPIR